VAVKLPRLTGTAPVVDKEGRPAITFVRYWQSFAEQIERVLNAIADILGITDQLDAAIQAARDAADQATAAAAAASDTTAANAREQALVSSYIEPTSVLTASPTTITIAAHTRHYSDGTTATVSAGSVAATASGDVDYVSYVDPTRVGGTVGYVRSTTPPVQTGDVHVVGAVEIPATGTAPGGEGPQRPGYVRPRQPQVDIE
jgi:hypothetical protein